MNEEMPRGAVVCRHSTQRWMKVVLGIAASIFLPVYLVFSRDLSKPMNLYALAVLILILVVVQVCAVVLTSKRLIVSEKGLVQRTILLERRVAFNEITLAERYADSQGEEELTIHYPKGRLRCNMSMTEYLEFVDLLSAFVPVVWRNKGALVFPVMVTFQRKVLTHVFWTVLGTLFTCAFAWGCYHYFARVEQREWLWVLIFGGLTLFCVAGNIISQQEFFGGTRSYLFRPDSFEIHSRRSAICVPAGAVQDIALQLKEEQDAIVGKLRIQFNNTAVEIVSTQTTVPLEPLCAMLRAAYLGETVHPPDAFGQV